MAGVQLRAFAEAIQGFVVHNSGYLECAPVNVNGRVPHYEIYTPPSGFTAVVTGIAYWNPAAPFTPAPLPLSGPSPSPGTAGASAVPARTVACNAYRCWSLSSVPTSPHRWTSTSGNRVDRGIPPCA